MQLSTSGDPFQPPLWQRSVKEELPAATILGCTAVTGLTKTERPPGSCVRNTLNVNVFMKLQGEPLLSTQNIRLTTNNYIMMFLVSCLAKKVRKVSSTCISCQVLSFWAVQVHAEPPRPSCRKNTSIFAKTPHFSSPSLPHLYRSPPCKDSVETLNVQFPSKVKTLDLTSKHIKTSQSI